MKKCIIISCITLLFLFTFSGALAEKQQIALTKELQALVNETGKFDEFTILTADEDTLAGHPTGISIFVLETKDYCVLFVAKEMENKWNLIGYTRKSLYPEKKQNRALQIQKIDSERFKMSWSGESYYYYAGGTENFKRLYRAEFDSNGQHCVVTGEKDDAGLLFSSENTSAYWKLNTYNRITWMSCNPLLFPKNIEAVTKNNIIFNVLNENHFGQDHIRVGLMKKNVKVYAAPNSGITVDTFALFQNETFSLYGNVDGWYFIGYQDDMKRAYFGYTTSKAFSLTKRELQISTCLFDSVALIASTDTFLTDDPVFSQEHYKKIPSGTPMVGLSGFDGCYAYVEVTIDGEIIRGFVPMKDLQI